MEEALKKKKKNSLDGLDDWWELQAGGWNQEWQQNPGANQGKSKQKPTGGIKVQSGD